MNWLIRMGLTFLDHTVQRAFGKGNRLQTLSGATGGSVIYAAMEYAEQTMGCDFGNLKFAALYPVLQGAWATGAKTTVTTKDDGSVVMAGISDAEQVLPKG